MAHEAVLIVETEPAIGFTVANATGIEKGTSLKLADLMSVSGSDAASDQFGGIAKSEKIASDGKVKLAVFRGGIFKVYLSGTCTHGDPAVTDVSLNYFKAPGDLTGLSGSEIAGSFLESGTDGQTVLMELRPQVSGASQ